MQFVPGPGTHDSPWESVTIATPSGTFTFPPARDRGAVRVSVTSKARKDNQKAAGRGKAKTKKSGPEPLDVTIELTFFSWQWFDADGAQDFLNVVDPNSETGGGPFDFQYPDFNRRGGKSIDIDEVGPVQWKGQIGTCTVKAHEWVPEPPKDAQGTKTPEKSAEYQPGDDLIGGAAAAGGDTGANGALIARGGVAQAVRKIAARGFDGPTTPGAKP
jgi:hypothetical protein